MTLRLDNGPQIRKGEARRDILGVQLRPARFTGDGAAVVQATLTRTGVFSYHDADGKEFREYRPPSEVFNEISMRSFEGVPVTDDHPSVLVDANNVSTYKRGRVAPGLKRDGIHMVGDLIIDDAGLLAKMKQGKLEISNGYTCDLEMTPGVSPEGERYDAIQRNIRGNHVAVVDYGRAGTARARMDGCSMTTGDVLPTVANDTKARLAHADAKERISSMEELQKKLGEALAEIEKQKARADKAEGERDAQRARADSAEKARDEQKTRADKAEGERDSEKTRADKAEGDAKAKLPAMAKQWSKLVDVATAALGADAKIGDKAICDCDERTIKVAVVQKVDGENVDKDEAGQPRPAVYVDARFDGCAKRVKVATRTDAGSSPFNQIAEVIIDAKTGNGIGNEAEPPDDEKKAREKMMQNSRDAHKFPNGNETEKE